MCSIPAGSARAVDPYSIVCPGGCLLAWCPPIDGCGQSYNVTFADSGEPMPDCRKPLEETA